LYPALATHLDRVNLGLELPGLVGGDRGGDDGARYAARTSESGLGGDEDVGNVLVLAKKGEVEENLDGLGVCSKQESGVFCGGSRRDGPAVMTMNSQIPRLRVLVASLAPFLSWRDEEKARSAG
jgi:hypothetical protein